MPLSFFEKEKKTQSLSWLSEWIEENPKGKDKPFRVEEFVQVQSGKGLLVKTENFAVFVFKKTKLYNLLLEALEEYVADEGFCIFCVPSDLKGEFQLATDFDQPCSWYNMGNGFTTTESQYSSMGVTGNPFKKPRPANYSLSSELIGDVSIDLSCGKDEKVGGNGRTGTRKSR